MRASDSWPLTAARRAPKVWAHETVSGHVFEKASPVLAPQPKIRDCRGASSEVQGCNCAGCVYYGTYGIPRRIHA